MNEKTNILNALSPDKNEILAPEKKTDENNAADTGLRKRAMLTKAGIDPDVLEEFIIETISSHPDIMELKETAKNAAVYEAQRKLDGDVAQISLLDPSVRTMEDIDNHPNGTVIMDYFMNKGYSLLDAYKLANFDNMAARKADAAKQSVYNSASKNHLQRPYNSSAGDLVSVPKDIYKQYKLINPKATDKEILAHFKKCKV